MSKCIACNGTGWKLDAFDMVEGGYPMSTEDEDKQEAPKPCDICKGKGKLELDSDE